LCNSDDLDRIEEREQTLISLLNSFHSTEINERFNLNRLLSLALNAKFYRVCEIIYEIKGEYYEIVDCYLNTELNSSDRQKQIFDIVRNILNILYESTTTTTTNEQQQHRTNSIIISQTRLNRSSTLIDSRDLQLRFLQEKLIRYNTLKQMVKINACETIHLLWIEMNIDLKYLIKTIRNYGNNNNTTVTELNANDLLDETKSIDSLTFLSSSAATDATQTNEKQNTEFLFKFMQGLFMLADLIKSNRKYMNYMSQFSAEYCELYVDLICLHEPDKLLNFLKTSLTDYSYRIEECLRICRERQVWDAAAYLLEKSGQIEAAFSLNLEKLTSLIRDQQKRLLNMSEIELNISKSNIDAMLIKIIQLCQRNSQSLNDSVKEKVWFSLFDEIMRPIHSLNLNDSNRDVYDFYKKLGAHIINSMVGYLNLTTIIDRIVSDPLYGASNFGDIKYLVCKMLEMCSYEQILLTKTASLVSGDVYSKLQTYKRYACKSFSSFANFCQYCSKPLDLLSSSNNNNNNNNTNNDKSNENLDSDFILIFHCGHSFHQICLEIMQIQKNNTICPICNSSSSSSNAIISNNNKQQQQQGKYKKKIDLNSVKPSTSAGISSDYYLEEEIDEEQHNSISNLTKSNGNTGSFNFTDNQIDALKSIRKRNLSQFKINDAFNQNYNNNNTNYRSLNTMLEKNGKLQLAPANLVKYY